TSTFRTSHPAGVTAWHSAPWSTLSSPQSLTTTSCPLPIANITSSWHSALQ
ncbi:hypothetical protein M9458_030447, partial [Cirrhinus mrigala]